MRDPDEGRDWLEGVGEQLERAEDEDDDKRLALLDELRAEVERQLELERAPDANGHPEGR